MRPGQVSVLKGCVAKAAFCTSLVWLGAGQSAVNLLDQRGWHRECRGLHGAGGAGHNRGRLRQLSRGSVFGCHRIAIANEFTRPLHLDWRPPGCLVLRLRRPSEPANPLGTGGTNTDFDYGEPERSDQRARNRADRIFSPGIFTMNAQGSGQGAVLDAKLPAGG